MHPHYPFWTSTQPLWSSAIRRHLHTQRCRLRRLLKISIGQDESSQLYILARLETLDHRKWFSLHLSYEDAERQLRAVADAWGVPFTPDNEPTGVIYYGADELPLLGPDESGEAPEAPIIRVLTKEEVANLNLVEPPTGSPWRGVSWGTGP